MFRKSQLIKGTKIQQLDQKIRSKNLFQIIRDEDYVEPIVEKKFQAFDGKGVSFGGTTQTGEINTNIVFKV